MDGASKFVRGDAIAGVVIILINIIGGLFIGVVQNGMSLGQAGSLFTTLTIGDGLVTQVPAFLISLAAGMLITRSNAESNLPSEFLGQLFSRPQALAVAAGFLGILIFTDLPRIPLLLIGAACAGLAVTLSRRERKLQADQAKRNRPSRRHAKPERVEDYLAVDPVELELGVGLIRLADAGRGGDLSGSHCRACDKAWPPKLASYCPRSASATTCNCDPTSTGSRSPTWPWLKGPSTGKPNDAARMITADLKETVRSHADELLTRDAVKHLLDELKKTSPAAVDELIPGAMKLGEVQQVLQMLLREGVLDPAARCPFWRRSADFAPHTKDPILLVEHVRRRLGRAICRRCATRRIGCGYVTLDPALEERIRAATEHTEEGLSVRLPPDEVDGILPARSTLRSKNLCAAGCHANRAGKPAHPHGPQAANRIATFRN